jgi:hypothetical protein
MNFGRGLVRLLTRRLTRRALSKPNLHYFLWRYVANGARTFQTAAKRPSFPGTDAIVEELKAQGIVSAPSDTFLTETGRAGLAQASHEILRTSQSESVRAVVAAGSSSAGKKDYVLNLVKFPHGVPADSPLLKVALDEKLLEIVSSYLGFWPCLYSISAWLNFPVAAPASKSQLWHRDPEDLQTIKVFIYLVDVDENCGPFTYIPRTHPFGADATSGGELGHQRRIPDESMLQVFPLTRWRVCTGPAQTMIMADTLGYHRGGRPTSGQRVLITFTYTSGTPITDPPISVIGTPAWMSARIQHAAVKPLLRPAHPLRGGSKKEGPRTEAGM